MTQSANLIKTHICVVAIDFGPIFSRPRIADKAIRLVAMMATAEGSGTRTPPDAIGEPLATIPSTGFGSDASCTLTPPSVPALLLNCRTVAFIGVDHERVAKGGSPSGKERDSSVTTSPVVLAMFSEIDELVGSRSSVATPSTVAGVRTTMDHDVMKSTDANEPVEPSVVIVPENP